MIPGPFVPEGDPYGMEYGDWEDPLDHLLVTLCTGCVLCQSWEGLSYSVIRADRRRQARKWREKGEASPDA